ncbi:glycosyl hydrolase family 18 [Leptospira selangorensis]|uniref:Glycosyl hydrolase family 18 n=1 Tax=Leptospira selangorensis TaxID=2484982 RepID=A0A5F2BYZ0_9LEPT|nr:glycosyl hydrolase family 18 protein [Leptospira selangorensis]TGM16078.1 glycosyl hydrolase family 18 [Leptospira selangorensis]TGM17971.1 glycosyl hydrolase family 18 [Leptospira selangorensis]
MKIFSRLRSIFTYIICISLCPLSAQENVWKYTISQDLSSKPLAYWEKVFKPGTSICFTGTYIGANGEVSGVSVPSALQTIGNKNEIRWFPLITFRSESVGKKVLASPQLRKALVRNLEFYLENHSFYSGIHLDFEGLGPEYSSHYKELLLELQPALRKKSKLLTLAVFPAEGFDPKLSGFHSAIYKKNLADEIVLMAYDLHSTKTAPGPVTEISWAKRNIEYLLKTYKSEQIWFGIPLYGYYWKKDAKRPKLLTQSSDENFVIQNGKEKDGIYLIHTDKGEGSLILDLKLWEEYAKNIKLKGLAFWRLGF